MENRYGIVVVDKSPNNRTWMLITYSSEQEALVWVDRYRRANKPHAYLGKVKVEVRKSNFGRLSGISNIEDEAGEKIKIQYNTEKRRFKVNNRTFKWRYDNESRAFYLRKTIKA